MEFSLFRLCLEVSTEPQKKRLRPEKQIRHPEADSKSEKGIKNKSDVDADCHKTTSEAC